MEIQFPVKQTPFEEAAKQAGTPYYLYHGDEIRNNFRTLKSALWSGLEFFFSLKANPNVSLVSLLHNEGAGTEVCSLTELKTVQMAGVPPEKIIFVGPAKSQQELTEAIKYGVYAIICESLSEFSRIEAIATELGVTQGVAMRVNPEFSAKKARLTMGGKPRQFGIDQQTLLAELPKLDKGQATKILGIHVYMGTRILSEPEVGENTKNILELADSVKELLGRPLEMVDIGGGLGVPYFANEESIDPHKVGEEVNPLLAAYRDRNPKTRVFMELGRYLVGASGVFVTRVVSRKESYGETFLISDGGTNCHMAAVGIGSFVKRNFPIASITHFSKEATEKYNLAGPLCTPNDVIGKAVELPSTEEGDLIGVFNSGAYGPSASPVNFLSFGHPAEVLYDQGKLHIIRESDKPEDLLKKQKLVTF